MLGYRRVARFLYSRGSAEGTRVTLEKVFTFCVTGFQVLYNSFMDQTQNDRFTIDDYAYALAQLTDDCEFEWVRQVTGLSYDECDKIMQIAYAAQQKVWS